MNIENRFFTGLGNALRNIRHERRLSYNDMPDIIKMSPETLMKMEAGSYLKNVSIRCLWVYANALDYDIEVKFKSR